MSSNADHERLVALLNKSAQSLNKWREELWAWFSAQAEIDPFIRELIDRHQKIEEALVSYREERSLDQFKIGAEMVAFAASAEPTIVLTDNTEIVVCSECLHACCWHGHFMCEKSQYADTVKKTVKELRALNLEHERWWSRDYG